MCRTIIWLSFVHNNQDMGVSYNIRNNFYSHGIPPCCFFFSLSGLHTTAQLIVDSCHSLLFVVPKAVCVEFWWNSSVTLNNALWNVISLPCWSAHFWWLFRRRPESNTRLQHRPLAVLCNLLHKRRNATWSLLYKNARNNQCLWTT